MMAGGLPMEVIVVIIVVKLELSLVAFIVRIAGRRQGHDVFIVFFIWAWVNFIRDKPHLIKEMFGNTVQPAFPKNLNFFFY